MSNLGRVYHHLAIQEQKLNSQSAADKESADKGPGPAEKAEETAGSAVEGGVMAGEVALLPALSPQTRCSTPGTLCGTLNTLCSTPSALCGTLTPCVVPLVPCVVPLVPGLPPWQTLPCPDLSTTSCDTAGNL